MSVFSLRLIWVDGQTDRQMDGWVSQGNITFNSMGLNWTHSCSNSKKLFYSLSLSLSSHFYMEQIKLIIIVPLCLHAPAVVNSIPMRYQIKYPAALHLCQTPPSNNDGGQRSRGRQSPLAYVCLCFWQCLQTSQVQTLQQASGHFEHPSERQSRVSQGWFIYKWIGHTGHHSDWRSVMKQT